MDAYKDEGYYTLIEMKDEISEAGEPVPIRRRPLYPAELWMHKLRSHIIQEDGRKVNSKGKKKGMRWFTWRIRGDIINAVCYGNKQE